MRNLFAAALFGACIAAGAPAAGQVALDGYIKKSEFEDIKISPDGQYFAATVPFDDRTGVAILRRSDSKILTSFTLGENNYIGSLLWANNERLLFRVAQKFGTLDKPLDSGQLLAMNVDEKGPQVLIGWRAGANIESGRSLSVKASNRLAALSVQGITGDDRNVIVTVSPYSNTEKWTRADRMDIYTGHLTAVARAPVKGAKFFADNSGVVRFALGSEYDNVSKLYYRQKDEHEWSLINDEEVTGRLELPIGFSDDNRIAYLQVEQEHGPDVITRYDTTTEERKEVLRDKHADPGATLFAFGASNSPVGAMYRDGRPYKRFFDTQSAEAKLYGLLETAFPDYSVVVTSTTRDGGTALVSTTSDRDPGSFYLFDIPTRKATYLLGRRDWIDPEKMASMKPVDLKARDGLEMRGYLTVPRGKEQKNLPLVVLPHGGPFGIFDEWEFNPDVQIMAAAGYAVLQVNYRGSGNYGRSFLQAGARQWGRKMQDDLTDATRWAIHQGIADPDRICIYGASYGAYASLMGAAKEPSLYKCAVGYVGVYDLPLMTRQDSSASRRLGNWMDDWVGSEGDQLAAISPNRLAGNIRVPVFLAAGGEDETAPMAHSEKMEWALLKAKIPVETLYFPTEGHGFYTVEHQREYYTKLLKFLDRNIGAQAASTNP